MKKDKNKKFREAVKAAALHPLLPTKYNAVERKKLRDFELSLFQTEADKKKYIEAIEGKNIER